MTTCRYFIFFITVLFFIPYYSNGQTNPEDNLLENASFENWDAEECKEWHSTTTASNATVQCSTDAHSGNYSICVVNYTSNTRLAYKEIYLLPGTYTFRLWVKAEDGVNGCLRLGYGTVNEETKTMHSFSYGDITYNITDWQEVSYTFELTSVTLVNLCVMNNKSNDSNHYSNLLIDDVSLTTTDGGIYMKGINGLVGALPQTGTNIRMAQMADAFTSLNISGAVFATCESGVVLGDNTGFIYYLCDSKFEVGDIVSLKATVMPYGCWNILTNGSNEITHCKDGIVSYPECITADGIFMNSWLENPRFAYIEFGGNLSRSGSNYNVNVEGADCVVSIVSPSNFPLEDLPDNCKVKVKGFAAYHIGDKNINIVATEVIDCTISNTIETAYSIGKCIELIDEGKGLENKVYIKGIVSAPYKNTFVDVQYGNATFFISEDGSTEGQQFQIYRGYDFGGEKFTEEKIKLGDEVVFYGTLTKYKDTYETYQGAELIYLNGADAEGNKMPCPAPTVEYINGQLHFNCTYSQAEIYYSITPCTSKDIKATSAIVTFAPYYTISCYATSPYRSQSEIVSITIPIPMGITGDMNADGKLSISDVTKLVDAIANGN